MSIDEIMNGLIFRAIQVTDECGIGMREDLIIATSTPGDGKPSDPGTPPNKQSGTLSAANQADLMGRLGDSVSAVVFNDCPYAPNVEATRPFFGPAADHWKQEYKQQLTQEFGG